MASQYGSTATVLVLLKCGAQVDTLDDVRVHKDVNYVKISIPALIINPWCNPRYGRCFM